MTRGNLLARWYSRYRYRRTQGYGPFAALRRSNRPGPWSDD